MKNIPLEWRLEKKTLSICHRQITLDDSLVHIIPLTISNKKGENEIALELGYQNRDPNFIENEAYRIQQSLAQAGIYEDEIQVNPYQEEEEFSTITLV